MSSSNEAACRSILHLGFWKGHRPVICKFTVDAQDVLREHKVLDDLWKDPPVTGIVGPVELLTFQSGARRLAPSGESLPASTSVHK